jgi:dinuclear metal center YbgI/SA1388 family protein
MDDPHPDPGTDGPDAADRVADWVGLVDARYPERDAQGWDATGLQVGHPDDPVRRVLVTLDVTDAVLDEAAEQGADLVLAHHPLLFRPLERLTPATAAGHLALRAARERRAVLAAHTNLDAALPGTTAPIVDLLDLRDVRPLQPLEPPDPREVKLVTFAPHEATAGVLAALSAAGAGHIGDYDHCSFRVAGTGTFRPSAAASPALGQRQQRNEVAEDRIEVVVRRADLAAVVEALVAAHPYEEVAYDCYPLVSPPTGKGIGRVGRLADPLPLRTVADRLAAGLPSPRLRVAGALDRRVERVAACGGAGDGLIAAASAAGADLYVTGDLRHHPALDAAAAGLALIDAGHYATEAPALPAMCDALARLAGDRGLRAMLLASAVRTEPWADYAPPARAHGDGEGDKA